MTNQKTTMKFSRAKMSKTKSNKKTWISLKHLTIVHFRTLCALISSSQRTRLKALKKAILDMETFRTTFTSFRKFRSKLL